MKPIFSLFLFTLTLGYVFGHGMLIDPINRSSRWRVDETAPTNYDDNQLFCGGFSTQWNENGGKCGMCGDNYADPMPRENELGGTFGQGVIMKKFKAGDVIDAQVLITANHKGYFTFNLCNLDDFKLESETCFNNILLNQTNGQTKYHITDDVGIFNVKLQLPEKVTCDHCVLQWTYTTGNSWGDCENEEGGMGCGEQEMFRTCSDIQIGV